MRITQQDEPVGDADPDLEQDLDSELTVVLDRWSVGQIGWPDFFVAVGVIAVAALLAYGVRRGIRRRTQDLEGPRATALNLLGQLISLGIYAFAIAVALDVLGFTSGPILVVLMLAFVLFFVFRPVIQSLTSGLFLQLRGYCLPGDVVAIDGETGTVDEVNSRSVVLETIDGRTVILPNDKVISEKIVNYSRVGRRRSHITLRLPSDTDLAEVGAQIRDTLTGVGSVIEEPPPRLVVTGFDGPQIWAEVHYWTGPDLEAEIAARDEVGRALTRYFQSATAPGDQSSIVQVISAPT